MRCVPTLILAAALSLGTGSSLASDLIAPSGQSYRFYNSDGTYSTLVVPSTAHQVAPGLSR